jgi:transcriptional regulator with XRE-family HTH domain
MNAKTVSKTDKPNPRSASPLDQHIGAQVRVARQLAGLTQETLAEHLGVTFQQVQKYERGANRVSASRLLSIASLTGQPLAFFYGTFTEAPEPPTKTRTMTVRLPESGELSAAQAQTALEALNRLPPKVRSRLVALMGAMNQAEDDNSA